jgi:hypothetical protein
MMTKDGPTEEIVRRLIVEMDRAMGIEKQEKPI